MLKSITTLLLIAAISFGFSQQQVVEINPNFGVVGSIGVTFEDKDKFRFISSEDFGKITYSYKGTDYVCRFMYGDVDANKDGVTTARPNQPTTRVETSISISRAAACIFSIIEAAKLTQNTTVQNFSVQHNLVIEDVKVVLIEPESKPYATVNNNSITFYLPAAKPGRDGENGKDGAPGVAGRDGKDGRDGQDGKDGRDGVDGAPGVAGRDGKNGKDATVELVKKFRIQAGGTYNFNTRTGSFSLYGCYDQLVGIIGVCAKYVQGALGTLSTDTSFYGSVNTTFVVGKTEVSPYFSVGYFTQENLQFFDANWAVQLGTEVRYNLFDWPVFVGVDGYFLYLLNNQNNLLGKLYFTVGARF